MTALKPKPKTPVFLNANQLAALVGCSRMTVLAAESAGRITASGWIDNGTRLAPLFTPFDAVNLTRRLRKVCTSNAFLDTLKL